MTYISDRIKTYRTGGSFRTKPTKPKGLYISSIILTNMSYKAINMDNAPWLKFKKLCTLNETTMKEQITGFIERYNKKHGGLIK